MAVSLVITVPAVVRTNVSGSSRVAVSLDTVDFIPIAATIPNN